MSTLIFPTIGSKKINFTKQCFHLKNKLLNINVLMDSEMWNILVIYASNILSLWFHVN